MLTNYHTHTTFCDGKNTPEEIVLYALEKGFKSIGFSGHGYTSFDLRYCMKNTGEYIKEITALKEKYKGKIQIYCGVEEDAFAPVDRQNFDYIIGSSHYFCVDGVYHPIDSGFDRFQKCLELFQFDVQKLAEVYYSHFTDYISKRKPDIVGHFDLITKFDEMGTMRFLDNEAYIKIAEKYMCFAAQNDVIFEVNTGAMARGYRKAPYPSENLLYILKQQEAKMILASDSHNTDNLGFCFEETERRLKDIGFKYLYELDEGVFVKRRI